MEAMDEPGPAYDDVEAKKGLAWFRATDAPHFTMSEPPGVSQTQYRVDLSTAPRVTDAELAGWLDDWVDGSIETTAGVLLASDGVPDLREGRSEGRVGAIV